MGARPRAREKGGGERLAPVVQKLYSAIQRINLYPVSMSMIRYRITELVILDGSLCVYGKLPTYPSLKPTFCPK